MLTNYYIDIDLFYLDINFYKVDDTQAVPRAAHLLRLSVRHRSIRTHTRHRRPVDHPLPSPRVVLVARSAHPGLTPCPK